MNYYTRYKILCRLRDYNYKTNYKTELFYQSSFELLIAVLLSAQTKDTQVNKVTKNLFKVANTPQAMLNLGLNKVRNYIKSIGLFNIKSTNIIKTCQLLINKHNGVVPENRNALESLPGVGRKTANVILNIIFGWPTIAVDTHVFRFCNRSQFAVGNKVTDVENKLMSVVPQEFKKNCHQWLVTHGRYICRSIRPLCNNCVINDLCEFKNKNIENYKKVNYII